MQVSSLALPNNYNFSLNAIDLCQQYKPSTWTFLGAQEAVGDVHIGWTSAVQTCVTVDQVSGPVCQHEYFPIT